MTVTMTFDLAEIKANIQGVLQNVVTQYPNWITKYNLVTFDSNTAQLKISTSNPTAFAAAVESLQMSGSIGVCPKVTVAALNLALQSSTRKGLIYTFLDSTASDYNSAGPVFQQLENSRIQANFFISNANPCGSPSGPGNLIYRTLAITSGGQAIYLQKSAVPQALNTIALRYSSNLVFINQSPTCGPGQTFYFPIDSAVSGFTVFAEGYNPRVTLTNPAGNQISGSMVISDILVAAIRVNNAMPGIWKATISHSSGNYGCSFQVFAQTSNLVYYGFTNNVHSDFPQLQPSNSQPNMMVAHLGSSTANLEYANLFDAQYNYISSTTFTQRNMCSFNQVSRPFNCPGAGFGVVMSGHDQQGYLFNRLVIAVCQSQGIQNNGSNTKQGEKLKIEHKASGNVANTQVEAAKS